MKVYVITRGDYSDYHIVGVSLDKKHAKEVAKLYSDDMYTARVEEYDSEEFTDARYPLWNVHFYTDDAPLVQRSTSDSYNGVPRVEEAKLACSGKLRYTVTVQAEDEEHALKIAADELAKYKAMKSFL